MFCYCAPEGKRELLFHFHNRELELSFPAYGVVSYGEFRLPWIHYGLRLDSNTPEADPITSPSLPISSRLVDPLPWVIIS